MNITLDAVTHNHNTGGNITLTNVTVGDHTNRLLLVSISSHQGSGATSVTYHGVAMTKLVTKTGSFGETTELWGLSNPDVGTTFSVVTSGISGGSFTSIGATSLYNCAPGLPTNIQTATGNSSSATLSITTLNANSWVVDSVEAEDRLTVNGSQTQDFNEASGNNFENGASSHILKATAGAQTMQWTLSSGQRWNIVAVEVLAASTLVQREPRFPILSIPLSNMTLWLKATIGVFSDSNLFTPAVIDTDRVGGWKDLSPLQNNATQSTSGNRPYYLTIRGKPAVYHSFTVNNNLALPSTFQTNLRNFTFIGVRALQQTQSITPYLQPAGGDGMLFSYSGANTPANLCVDYGSGVNESSPVTLASFEEAVVGLSLNASHSIIHFNNSVQNATPGSASTSNAGTIGLYESASIYFKGYFREIICFNQALGTADMQLIKNYLYRKYGIIPTKTNSVVCDGDSITQGNGSSNMGSWFDIMCRNLTGAYQFFNLGVAGETLASMLTNAPTFVDPLYNSGMTKNICVIFAGTNDIFNGDSASTVYNRLVSYGQGRQAAGYKVVVVTMLPRGAGLESTRTSYNSSIRSNWATFADALADVASDPNIGQAGQNTNHTYYDVDNIHPNNTGYAVIEPYIETAVLSL